MRHKVACRHLLHPHLLDFLGNCRDLGDGDICGCPPPYPLLAPDGEPHGDKQDEHHESSQGNAYDLPYFEMQGACRRGEMILQSRGGHRRRHGGMPASCSYRPKGKGKKKQTNVLAAHVGQEMTTTQCRKYQLHAAKCKCMNLDPRNMHIGRTAAWTKWEQLRWAVQVSTISWAGREAREGVTPSCAPTQSDVCTGGNKFQRWRWRSRYGSCAGTRKDQQLAPTFSSHPSCLRLWRLWEISHQELFFCGVCSFFFLNNKMQH